MASDRVREWPPLVGCVCDDVLAGSVLVPTGKGGEPRDVVVEVVAVEEQQRTDFGLVRGASGGRGRRRQRAASELVPVARPIVALAEPRKGVLEVRIDHAVAHVAVDSVEVFVDQIRPIRRIRTTCSPAPR